MSCQNSCVGVLLRQLSAMWRATQRASCSAATMTAGVIAHPVSHNATVPSLISRSWKRTWRRATRPGAAWTMSSWSQVHSPFWPSEQHNNIFVCFSEGLSGITKLSVQCPLCTYWCEIKDSIMLNSYLSKHIDIKRKRRWIHAGLVYVCCSLSWVL